MLVSTSRLTTLLYMNNLTHHFFNMLHLLYSKKAYRELNLVRALDEDTRVFSFSFSPLDHAIVHTFDQ